MLLSQETQGKILAEVRKYPQRRTALLPALKIAQAEVGWLPREAIADVAKELDLLVVSDEVYEHYVTGENPHTPIASLPEMHERTITVNSFSKSWNISGWRLGYCFGKGELIAPINNAANVIYVCPATPLQAALSKPLDDVRARLGAARRPDLTTFHVVRRENLKVAQQLRAVNGVGLEDAARQSARCDPEHDRQDKRGTTHA